MVWMSEWAHNQPQKWDICFWVDIWNTEIGAHRALRENLSIPLCRGAGDRLVMVPVHCGAHPPHTAATETGMVSLWEQQTRPHQLHLQHPQSIPVTAKGWFCYVLCCPQSIGYKPALLTACVWKDLLQEQQLHNGNQHWPKIFERNIFWEKIQVEPKRHVLQENINSAETFKEKFHDMTVSHLDKAEKKCWYCIIWL